MRSHIKRRVHISNTVILFVFPFGKTDKADESFEL